MAPCPSEEVLILYASLSPGEQPEDDELLDGWTARSLADHLDRCAACERVVRQSGELLGALQADELTEPPDEFWDELADGVMRSIDADSTEAPEDNHANVVPLPELAAAPAARPSNRRSGRWLWAAAAALAMALAVWSYDEVARDGETETVADGGVDGLIPNAEQANQLAAELGITLEGFDAKDVTPEVDLLDLGSSFSDAGLSALGELVDDNDMDDLELALADGDPIGQLLELDTEELALVLEALES